MIWFELVIFCIDSFEYPNVEGKMPMGSIQWSDAQEECQSVGKRVCTEAEVDIGL